MNFADIIDISIPNGSVTKITDASNQVLWEKPFSGKAFTMQFKKVDDYYRDAINITTNGLVKLTISGGYFYNDLSSETNIGNSQIFSSGYRTVYYKETSNPTTITVYNPQNITGLYFEEGGCDLYSFSNLSTLTNLESLTVKGLKSFTSQFLISNLPSLKYLTIGSYNFTVADGEVAMRNVSISNLPELISLLFSQPRSTLSLSGCPNLKTADVNADKISGGLSIFSGLTNLTALNLINLDNTTGSLSAFSNLTKLENLTATATLCITGDLSALSNLVNMKYLFLGDCINATGNLSSLSKMSKLTSLDLSSSVVQKNSSGTGYSPINSKFTGDASVMNIYAPNLKTFNYQYSAITGTWTPNS